MTKREFPVMISRQLQRRGATNIPERSVITSIYQKFLDTDTDSVGDSELIQEDLQQQQKIKFKRFNKFWIMNL